MSCNGGLEPDLVVWGKVLRTRRESSEASGEKQKIEPPDQVASRETYKRLVEEKHDPFCVVLFELFLY